jgi:photosystem II stability/assembly factor-like uncharacterized protein
MKRSVILSLLTLLVMILAACAQNNTSAPTPNGVSVTRPSGVQALAIDPRDGHLLRATSEGLFQSLDGGKSWQAMMLPANIAGKAVSQVAIHKDRPDTIYIAGEQIGIWRSRDAGKTWDKVTRGLPNDSVTALALHSNGYPRDDSKSLFAWIAGVGIFESHDEGDNWKRPPDQGPPNPNVQALTHSPLPESMNTGWLYASTPDGAYLSMDCF